MNRIKSSGYYATEPNHDLCNENAAEQGNYRRYTEYGNGSNSNSASALTIIHA